MTYFEILCTLRAALTTEKKKTLKTMLQRPQGAQNAAEIQAIAIKGTARVLKKPLAALSEKWVNVRQLAGCPVFAKCEINRKKKLNQKVRDYLKL